MTTVAVHADAGTELRAGAATVPGVASPGAPDGAPHVLGLATPGLRTLAEVDARATAAGQLPGWPDDALLCSHLVTGDLQAPRAHLALSVTTGRPLHPDLVVALLDLLGSPEPSPQAQAQARTAAAGRAVVFRGVEQLLGRLTVGELLARSAVDRVVALAGTDVAAGAVVDTRGFVRPHLSGGRLVLTVQPARAGVWVPFEDPSPEPCCGEDH